MNIVVMGPAGSGKTTQAQLLADYLGVPHLNVGDLLYFYAKEESETGKRVKEAMESGELVEDDLTLRLVEEHLGQLEHKNGTVVDGFPRSLSQAEKLSISVDLVFYLRVSDDVTKERLLKRGRSDDTQDLINKRLEVYHRETEPILEYYRKNGVLACVDGEKDIQSIFQEIQQKLTER